MKIPSLEFLGQAYGQAFRRFPAAMICALCATTAVIVLIQFKEPEGWAKFLMVAALGISAFTGLTAYGEMKNWPERTKWTATAIVAALLTGYYFWLDPDGDLFERVEIPRYLAWLAVAHLWVSFAPFLKNGSSTADFWEYNKQLFVNIITAGFYSFVLWAGLSAAILAVDQLFDVGVKGETYGHLLTLIVGVFSSTFFLYHFPKDFRFDADEIAFTAIFKNLCKFILIPIVGLYFFILYAYSAKILTAWSLPHGWVSMLIIGFATAGIFTWLLNFSLPRYDAGSIVNGFKRWFWPVLFPMVGLLFVAIARRIWDYGITEERFFVAHVGAWLTLCCVFFVLIKSDDIKFIPMSLAAFALVSVYGPFSAFESTKRSQTHHLKVLLEKNGLFADGKAKSAATPLRGEDAGRIRSCLQVLNEAKALKNVEPWLEKPIAELPQAEGTYGDDDKVATYLNIANNWSSNGPASQRFSIWTTRNETVQIAGYQEFVEVNGYLSNDAPTDSTTQILVDSLGQSLVFWRAKTEVDRFPMGEVLGKWRAAAPPDDYSLQLADGQNVIPIAGEKHGALLLVRDAAFEQTGDTLRLTNLEGFLFLKKK